MNDARRNEVRKKFFFFQRSYDVIITLSYITFLYKLKVFSFVVVNLN